MQFHVRRQTQRQAQQQHHQRKWDDIKLPYSRFNIVFGRYHCLLRTGLLILMHVTGNCDTLRLGSVMLNVGQFIGRT